MLTDSGDDLLSEDLIVTSAEITSPKNSDYVGSVCLHIYKNKLSSHGCNILKTIFIGDLPFLVLRDAIKSIEDSIENKFFSEEKTEVH